MTKRAAVYARYSSDEQTGGESIEYQLDRCREHVVEQGWFTRGCLAIEVARKQSSRDVLRTLAGAASMFGRS